MTQEPERALTPESEKPKPTRRRMGVRSLLILVASFAAMLWSYRYLSENFDPLLDEFRTIRRRSTAALHSGTKQERLEAIEAIWRLPKIERSITISSLTDSLDDPEGAVSTAVAPLLREVVDDVARSTSAEDVLPTVEAALIGRIKRPDASLRVNAVEMVGAIAVARLEAGARGKLVEDATAALLASLRDPNPRVREAAATALGNFAPNFRLSLIGPSDLKTLMESVALCLQDVDGKVRHAAIVALTRSHDEDDEPQTSLMKCLTDESAENRLATVRGLDRYKRGLNPWAPILFRILEEDADPEMQAAYSSTLIQAFNPPAITPELIPLLTSSLGSKNVRIRSHAASLLGFFGEDATIAVPALLKVLKEPLDPRVATLVDPAPMIPDPGSAAASSLGKIAPGTSKGVEVLAALLDAARSGPAERRAWAATSLGGFGTSAQEVVPILIQVIKESDPSQKLDLVTFAIEALGNIAPDTPAAGQTVEALVPLLKSDYLIVLIKAAEALAKFGSKVEPAIPALRELTSHQFPPVREAAAKALKAIEPPSAK